MKKFLITGIGGFVALHLLEYLNEKNFEILGLDIVENFECRYRNVKYKKINLCDKAAIREVLANFKPDYIVHLAAISSVSKSWTSPVDSFVNNTNIFLNIIESVRELELKTRILSVGSSEEYGNYPPEKMPLKETYELRPDSPYAVARVSQEMLSVLYAKYYGLDIVITRSFNHIGPKQKDIFVVPSFVKQLINIKNNSQKTLKVGNIEIIRDFLDVRDVVRAYYKLLENGKSGDIYNVCSGIGTKLKDIINIVSEELGIQPVIEIDKERLRPTDNDIIIGDNSKIKTELGWSPKYTLKQTLIDMIKEVENEY